jgi:hypothetical protein
MTQLFAHLADDRDDGRPQYWDGGFRGHAWCDSRILVKGGAISGSLASRYCLKERGRRECRYLGRFGDRNLRDSA